MYVYFDNIEVSIFNLLFSNTKPISIKYTTVFIIYQINIITFFVSSYINII